MVVVLPFFWKLFSDYPYAHSSQRLGALSHATIARQDSFYLFTHPESGKFSVHNKYPLNYLILMIMEEDKTTCDRSEYKPRQFSKAGKIKYNSFSDESSVDLRQTLPHWSLDLEP